MNMDVNDSLLDLIGNTPMMKLKSLDTGPCDLYVKLELNNPGGSIKDRVGLSIIEEAEKSGELKPGGTIIEATAGNTGIGLALIAALKGYKIILVIPDKMSREKILHLELYKLIYNIFKKFLFSTFTLKSSIFKCNFRKSLKSHISIFKLFPILSIKRRISFFS